MMRLRNHECTPIHTNNCAIRRAWRPRINAPAGEVLSSATQAEEIALFIRVGSCPFVVHLNRSR
jgi:hypothetical protein